jgi:hypothetical protein
MGEQDRSRLESTVLNYTSATWSQQSSTYEQFVAAALILGAHPYRRPASPPVGPRGELFESDR